MDETQENKDVEQPYIYIHDCAFTQVAQGKDYIVYQACEPRVLGEMKIDLFLEYVSDKGWWGVIRLNGRFTIQLKLSPQALFPTSEIAFLVTEEFLAEEHRVHEAFKDMKEQKQARQILHHVPLRPVDVDPERYFSPSVLEVNGIIYGLIIETLCGKSK